MVCEFDGLMPPLLRPAPLSCDVQAVYAVGDCCTKFQFTHAADFMARIVIRNALFFGEIKLQRRLGVTLHPSINI